MYRFQGIAKSFRGRQARLAAMLALFMLLVLASFTTASASDRYRFEGVERVVAFGDVHGAYPELTGLLREAGIIDADLRWAAGRTHLVSTGDLFSRGDQARQVIELLMRLQSEAAEAGGAVHVLLGNHEVMSLTGDLRYVTPGGFAAFDDGSRPDSQPPGYLQRMSALAPDGAIGQWLLHRPVMIVVNGDLFLHGGVSPSLKGKSLEQINAEALADVRGFAKSWHALMAAGALPVKADFDAILATAQTLVADSEDAALAEAAQTILQAVKGLPFQPDGPVWYRGNSLCHPFVEQPMVEEILAGLGARRLVIGHTPTLDRRISSRLDGHVLRMDTGMNKAAYRGRPSLLILQGDQSSALYSGEGTAELVLEPNRVWARPFGMSDAQIEEFLANAPISKSEDLGVGVTNPKRLTLERDGQTLRAVFKSFDSDPGIEGGVWRKSHDAADRFVYDLVAYRLDRILGFEMVPVAALRTVDGKPGVVQHWIEDSVNDADRQRQKIAYDSDCDLGLQYNAMNVFDVLIHNVDRNLGNVLYDRDWQVWLIDHTRAFGTQRRRAAMLRKAEITVNAPLQAALERVDAENLEPLSPYLNPRQIQSLIQRAQGLLDRK